MVSVFGVSLNKCQIAVDHFQGGMAEHSLQTESIAAVTQEIDSEGMAEAMGMGGGNDTSPVT